MSWNEQNVARLRELWDQGLPTSQIGKLLGFTKNAVVGKAHRVGLERRPSPIRRTAVKPDRKKARSPIMPKLNFENNQPPKQDLNYKSSNGAVIRSPFATNQTRGCEWPIGHPDEKNFHFCSKERFHDKSYCLEHCAIAYVIPEKEEELSSVTQVV
tara:strand:+ start:483 stop:950 length:468 start_codon:yes stop_codon:yes gene_type:complete